MYRQMQYFEFQKYENNILCYISNALHSPVCVLDNMFEWKDRKQLI